MFVTRHVFCSDCDRGMIIKILKTEFFFFLFSLFKKRTVPALCFLPKQHLQCQSDFFLYHGILLWCLSFHKSFLIVYFYCIFSITIYALYTVFHLHQPPCFFPRAPVNRCNSALNRQYPRVAIHSLVRVFNLKCTTAQYL